MKTVIKKLISILVAIMSLGLLVACSKAEVKEISDNKTVINVVAPDGLPAMAVAKLIKENIQLEAFKSMDIKYSVEKSSDALVTAVLKREPDIAIVPSNVAATAYNKTEGEYKVVGTTGSGSFYLVSTEELKNLQDIKGKTVVAMGKGLTPDLITQGLLKKLGINGQTDVNFSYVNSPNEIVPMIVAGKETTAIIPEPALTALLAAKPQVKVIASLNEEWKKAFNTTTGYPQATIIVRSEILKSHKDFVEAFLSEVEGSINWSYDNKDEFGQYCEEIGLSAKKEVLIKSLERANLKYIGTKDSIEEYNNYYTILSELDAKAIGGQIPNEEIYMD